MLFILTFAIGLGIIIWLVLSEYLPIAEIQFNSCNDQSWIWENDKDDKAHRDTLKQCLIQIKTARHGTARHGRATT